MCTSCYLVKHYPVNPQETLSQPARSIDMNLQISMSFKFGQRFFNRQHRLPSQSAPACRLRCQKGLGELKFPDGR